MHLKAIDGEILWTNGRVWDLHEKWGMWKSFWNTSLSVFRSIVSEADTQEDRRCKAEVWTL